jgi:hypothetical protein
MQRIVGVWSLFWFSKTDGRELGGLRVWVGLVSLWSILIRWPSAEAFLSNEGVLTTEFLTAKWHTPWHMLATLIDTPLQANLLMAAVAALSLTFMVGLRSRTSAVVLLILLNVVAARNPWTENGADVLIRNIIYLYIFAPRSLPFSLDLRFRSPSAPPLRYTVCVQKLICIQMTVVWFMSGYHKATGPLWSNGWAIYYVLGDPEFTVANFHFLMNFQGLTSTLTIATIVTELIVPWMLWQRGSRWFALAAAFGIQAWILIGMILPVFPLISFGGLMAFLSDEEWADLSRAASRGVQRFWPG